MEQFRKNVFGTIQLVCLLGQFSEYVRWDNSVSMFAATI